MGVRVWARLHRDGSVASREAVWAMMPVLGRVLPPVREREELVPRGQVAVPGSNRRWATDLTTVWTQEDGLVAVVAVVACGDREVLECEVVGILSRNSVLSA